jgi:hypothetical protein
MATNICVGILSHLGSIDQLNNFMYLYKNILVNKNVKYYIIYADPNIQDYYKLDSDNNIIYVKAEECYEYLARKLVLFYKYIYENTSYEYVVKVNDICKINIDWLISHPHINYGGDILHGGIDDKWHFGKCKYDYNNNTRIDFKHKLDEYDFGDKIDTNKLSNISKIMYCNGGTGYILSRKSISYILQYIDHILNLSNSYEDMIFAQLLYLNDIMPTKYVFGWRNQYALMSDEMCVGILSYPNSINRLNHFMNIYRNHFINRNIKYYIIYADPNIPNYYKLDEEKNIIYVKTEECYEYLSKKLVLFYKYIYENTSYGYIAKVDERCKINIQWMVDHPRIDYCGDILYGGINDRWHFGKCKYDYNNHTRLDFRHKLNEYNFKGTISNLENKMWDITRILYCNGGAGYIISRNSIRYILQYIDHILNLSNSYEDLLFGQLLYLNDIKAVKYTFGWHYQA